MISMPFLHSNEWSWDFEKCRKPCQKQPLPLEARGLPYNTWMPGPTPLTTPHDSSIAICTFTQWRNKNPHWLQWDAANSLPNCPFPFDDHHQNLIHPYRARPHSPPQTASGSNQPFCRNSCVRTDRWGSRMFSTKSAALYRERRANNSTQTRFIAVSNIHGHSTLRTIHHSSAAILWSSPNNTSINIHHGYTKS